MQLEFGYCHTINLAWAGCQQDCSLPVNSNSSLPIVPTVQEYATSHVKQEYQGAVLSLPPPKTIYISIGKTRPVVLTSFSGTRPNNILSPFCVWLCFEKCVTGLVAESCTERCLWSAALASFDVVFPWVALWRYGFNP